MIRGLVYVGGESETARAALLAAEAAQKRQAGRVRSMLWFRTGMRVGEIVRRNAKDGGISRI